ncbi:MAG TPA: glycerol-3-phosphate dehydrogenase/oxidase [Gemmatimonadales bacterium]
MRRDLGRLADTEFDVVVIGGGVSGAAIAWDAALRGLSVALLERTDFCAETSAWSLKVVHGGIRYLQHLDFKRVRESCRERSALLRIAPHLVHPMPFVVPTYGHGMQGSEALGAAFLLLSAVTADRNRGIPDPERRIPAGRLVSRRQLLEWFPHLDSTNPVGAGVFSDGQMYNPPRLVWEFVRSAAERGALVANHCEVTGLLRQSDRVTGVRVTDRIGGGDFDVRARVVVNAAGPFAEQLYLNQGLRPKRTIPLSRDMAVVIRRPLVTGRALAAQTRYKDPDAVLSRGNRHVFLVPWRGRTLIGVNSRVWPGDPYALEVTEAEVASFVEEIQSAAPEFAITLDDIAMVYAGLLPFGQNDAGAVDLSFGKRSHLIDHEAADGIRNLVSAISIRFTTARGLAEEAMNLVVRKLGLTARCRTEDTPLYGARFERFAGLVEDVQHALGAAGDDAVALHLAHNHGSAFGEVLRLAEAVPNGRQRIAGTDTIRAEIVHAVREELASSLADCVLRRTDLGTGGRPDDAALAEAADMMAAELGWTADRRTREVAEVQARYPGWSTA